MAENVEIYLGRRHYKKVFKDSIVHETPKFVVVYENGVGEFWFPISQVKFVARIFTGVDHER